ncbi:general stress protein [Priestia sp. OVL9]|nr:general stress protein [Priestia sp. OVL9]
MEAKAKNVVGIYETEQEAVHAVESLKKKGMHRRKFLSSANIKRPKTFRKKRIQKQKEQQLEHLPEVR